MNELAAQAAERERLNDHAGKSLGQPQPDAAWIHAAQPADFTGLEVTEREHVAAGVPAVIATMRHAVGEMGVKRALQTLSKVNQHGGFDCQSCAWADPDGERHLAEFCENGAKAVADEATRKRATPEFFARYSVAELSEKSDYWLGQQGRITQPMYLAAGATHYAPITWENALGLLARELNALASPDEAIFYTSGRTSNEAAYLYQLFVRQYGTNNMPDCSNMCHESSGAALKETIGIGKGTVTLEDFEQCDLIMILGQNPGTNHPRMLTTLENAKRNGAKIIGINPLPEAGLISVVNPNPQEYRNPLKFPVKMLTHSGTPLSDLFLPVRINGDMALLKGMMKVILEADSRQQAAEVAGSRQQAAEVAGSRQQAAEVAGSRQQAAGSQIVSGEQQAAGGGQQTDLLPAARRLLSATPIDHKFIEQQTSGFEALRDSLAMVSWNDITTQSGLSKAQIRQAAEMYLQAERVITCWAMGLTQHKNAVGTIQEIVNLHLLRGNIGRAGAGVCPVRGHSNVQGDRTMGIWEKPTDEFLDALEKEFRFTAPRYHGVDTVAAINAMHAGKCKIFFALGGNFLSATPDTDFTASALRRCTLTAQVITKLNRTALVTGRESLILPCLGRTEKDLQATGPQFVSCENSMGVVQMSKGVLEPASSDLRSEVWIVTQLAKAVLGDKSATDWAALASDYDRIRDKIERTIPGFEDYNRRVREAGGFYLPNAPREGKFPTYNKKANFTVHPLPKHELAPNQFVLMTIRTHDQFNTTIYGLNDRYRGIHNERRIVLLNRDDIAEFGWRAGQVVDITSHFSDGTRFAPRFIVVPYDIPRRSAAIYFPEGNVLVPIGSVAEKSNTPVSKFVVVTIAPSSELRLEP